MLGGRRRGRLVVLADFLIQIGMRLGTIAELAPVIFRDFTLGGIEFGQSWVAVVERSESFKGEDEHVSYKRDRY